MTEERKRLMTLLCEAHNIACYSKLFDDATHAQQLGKEADHLLANGVTFVTDNNDGCKRIEELEAQLAEREKVVIQLRKQWQDAEMHICTMCGHFDHKTDGNIVYGNMTCGEICGYPFCAAKFSPWIPVSERLPDTFGTFIVAVRIPTRKRTYSECADFDPFTKKWTPSLFWGNGLEVTHWMPLPEPPKE